MLTHSTPGRQAARFLGVSTGFLVLALGLGYAEDAPKGDNAKPADAASEPFKPEEVVTAGTVGTISYQAIAGTLVVHPKNWDDVKDPDNKDNPSAVASMFYTAYFKKDAVPGERPLTFFFNGGPGASTVWLHMGSFGPVRVVTADAVHTPAAPYKLIANDSTLLDASDLVFIDAPGTGFSRTAGKDAAKAFYGVDQDAYAFSQFIQLFLSKYSRWNSPKYLFGESYGTPRNAALIALLETDAEIDFNGIIQLSQCLNFDLFNGVESNPGVDLQYIVALPTYAAAAWYHHKLPGAQPADLPSFLEEVEHFATGDYTLALTAGAALDEPHRQAIAERLHRYTGLPVAYILKADLRINGGVFEKSFLDEEGLTTSRLDSRFSGPSFDPLSKEADYDPLDAAIGSAFVSAFNDYVRKTLHYGQDRQYIVGSDSVNAQWDFKHAQPGESSPDTQALNVMVDLSVAMKYNPELKVLLLGGYFDLATPFFEGVYEMHHLQIPQKLQANISYRYYQSGHMIYAHPEALVQLHADVAAFIRATENVPAK